MNGRLLSIITSILLVAFAAGVSTGCDSEASEVRQEADELDPTPVDTLVLSSTDFVDTFQVLGTAEPVESIDVAADVPGEIKDVYIEQGDRVRRGDPLFRIDTEVDEAGRDALQTQLEAAQRELDRLEGLREQGLATDQQVDNAQTELDAARDNLRQTEVNIGRSLVRSPIDARVATRMADAGEFANAGAPLAELIDFETIAVYAQVPESQIRYVDVDEQIELNVEIPAVDDSFEGTIDRVALRPTQSTRTYSVEIHIDNQDHRIRPGMRSRVHFKRQHYPDAVVIPRDSILEGYRGREVMVVTGDDDIGRAQVRPIETGPGTRDNIVVLSGLEAGERLVLRGHRGLVGDARIEVIDESYQNDSEDDS